MTIRQICLALPLLVMGWVLTLVLVSYYTDKAPAHVVLFPSHDFLQHMPDHMRITDATGWSVTITSDVPELAKTLYASGALIVLPSGLKGCVG